MKTRPLSPRQIVTIFLLIATIILFAYFAAPRLPAVLQWIPDDYAYFLRWGRDAQHGIYAYRYPLPTDLWIFLPLSLLPTWFALVWVTLPFIFTLLLFGKRGVVLWLSYPMIVHAALGQIDGWLLVPIFWLLSNHARWAGFSAAIVSLKPQLAIFLVPFMIYRWFKARNWRTLTLFGGSMIALYAPAFLADSQWVFKMIAEVQVRAGESILTTRGATLWAWWWRGDGAMLMLPLLGVLVVYLLTRSFRDEQKQSRAVHLLGLVLVPVLYAVSFVAAIPALAKSTRQLVTFTIVSWLCAGLDILFQGWGGVYILIPLSVLWFVARSNSTPPTPTTQTARQNTFAMETKDTPPRD